VEADDRDAAQDVVVHLDRVTPEEVAAEARRLGFINQRQLRVPESEQYLGSTVVVLQAPRVRAIRRLDDARFDVRDPSK
jgi:hypothetical protein